MTDLKATLNASGSTLAKPYLEEAAAAFNEKNKGVQINYAGGGSGKGRTDFSDQVTDFGASDSPFKDEDKAKVKGGEFFYFPFVLAPITVSYNLDGVSKLQLTPATIAKIFQRDVKVWNDPAIAADNPGVTLPATAITVAHRSDGSGTTQNFTEFLNKAVGGDGTWKLKSGSTVEWPADTQGAEGNSGVAKIVKDTKGGIGYVDYSDAKANGLKFASVQNKAGKFVEATLAGASAAAAGAEIKADLTFSSTWATGDAAYPIAAQAFLLVYKNQPDKAKGEALKAFIQYALTDGQTLAAKVDYAALPKSVADKAVAQLLF